MSKYLGSLASYPARTVAAGYLATIVVGGALLSMPFSSADPDRPISVLDGLFTATSATCVTGLCARSTEKDFSLVGQWIILGLFQAGGVGIMTLSTLATMTFWSGESIRHRTALSETVGLAGLSSGAVVRRILLATATLEAAGATILFLRMLPRAAPLDAAYFAVFHSVSAFCNAGFALSDGSLCEYVGDFAVNGVVMTLLVLGGLGFPVLEDLWRGVRSPRGFRWEALRLQSKVVLSTAAVLLIGGALAIGALEWNHSFRSLSSPTAVLASLFQSATTRTAGFNTVEISNLAEATLFVMILLMVVGGAPCSTAGGAKTSTVALVALSAWCRIRGRRETTVFKRTLDRDLVARATAVVLLYLTVAAVGVALLLAAEARRVPHEAAGNRFMQCVFEAFSALGTVGLSTGLTGELSPMGKIVVIGLMYVGRIGPISLALAISRETQARRIEYAKENLLIG
jgi:trk system potassium uptake protein TrkH